MGLFYACYLCKIIETEYFFYHYARKGCERMGRPKGSKNVVRAKSDYKPEYAGMLLEFFRHYSEAEEAGVPTLQRFAQSIGTYACAVPPGLYHGRSRRRDRFRAGIHARLRRSILRLRLPEKDRRGKDGGEVRGIEGKHRACGERMRGAIRDAEYTLFIRLG